MAKVIVLMYHRLGSGEFSGRADGEALYAVPVDSFDEQLDILSRSGLPVLPLEAVSAVLGRGEAVSGVSVTFDDGNLSDLQHACPSLLRRGYRGTFFVTPAFVGGQGYLEWTDVQALAHSGMEVGAHGFEHVSLKSLSEPALRWQLRESRRSIEAGAGVTPRLMSLPNGSGGAREVRIAREEGFALVAGSVPRIAHEVGGDEPLPRYAVRRGDSVKSFEALIRGGRIERFRRLARHRAAEFLRAGVGERWYQAARRGLASRGDRHE